MKKERVFKVVLPTGTKYCKYGIKRKSRYKKPLCRKDIAFVYFFDGNNREIGYYDVSLDVTMIHCYPQLKPSDWTSRRLTHVTDWFWFVLITLFSAWLVYNCVFF